MNVTDQRTIAVRAVAVGRPSIIGQNRKGHVISGISKRVIATETVKVGPLNIEGDGQADLRNHGGVDKAVYCYPAEHLAFWKSELGYEAEEAPFGENLSTLGVIEEDARIGDVWRWGTAVLQISQPRWPCYKLALHSGHNDMVPRFVDSGRSGWYLRVLEPGTARRTAPIVLEARDPADISVRMAFDAARGTLDSAGIAEVNAHPALAEAWRR